MGGGGSDAARSMVLGLSLLGGTVLWAQAPATPKPAVSGAQIEFADDPNFAVAGVTDWTAVGGHGSDAVLRTSEDLTQIGRAHV